MASNSRVTHKVAYEVLQEKIKAVLMEILCDVTLRTLLDKYTASKKGFVKASTFNGYSVTINKI